MEKKKIKVVFTFVDAGSGHIVPLNAIYDAFKKKYGKYVELVHSDFFYETKNPELMKFGNMIKKTVADINKSKVACWIGNMYQLLPIKVGVKAICHNVVTIKAQKAAYDYINEINADVHITNHFFPIFYYEGYKKLHPDKKILNICINQDCRMLPYNLYPSDLLLTPYHSNLVHYPHKYKWLNEKTFKLIPFPLREEFATFDPDKVNKQQEKQNIGINPNKMTIAILEGGYGIGNGYKVLRKLLKTDLNLNIIYFTGKNEKLFKKLNDLKLPNNISLHPIGYTKDVIKYLAASDVALVKSGPNALAEVAALGLPAIAIQANFWHERVNARFYQNIIGNTCFIPHPKKVVNKIVEIYNDKELLNKMSANAINNHLEYNNEKIADILFAKIKEKFPDIDK